jgi:hypothetical protein
MGISKSDTPSFSKLERYLMAKSTCPVTRAEFVSDAKPVEVVINGIPMTAEV